MSNGCKSTSRPDNGKATAKDKGVRGDTESEGSRRQTSALMHKNMRCYPAPLARDQREQLAKVNHAEIIKSESDDFARLYRLLTSNQAQLLRAIADEGAVTAINATAFITAHHLKGTSSINKALEALIDKEYVYASGHGYIVYDRFMGLWLQTIL